MPILAGLGFHPLPVRPKTLRFLSVCLFVRHAFERQSCAPDFAVKALEYRNDFDTVGYRKVCSCAPCFNFLRLPPTGDTTKCLNPKNGKLCRVSPLEGGRINRSRRNLVCKHTPLVCSIKPNLALIGERRSVQESPRRQNLPQIVVFGHRKPTQ